MTLRKIKVCNKCFTAAELTHIETAKILMKIAAKTGKICMGKILLKFVVSIALGFFLPKK